MTCPVCGNAYPCIHSRRNSAVLADPETCEDSEQVLARKGEGPGRASTHQLSAAAQVNEEYWRREVASRVRRHRARRHKRSDSDGTLELDFTSTEVMNESPEPMIRAPHVRRRITAAREEVFPPAHDGEMGEQVETGAVMPEPPKVIRFPRAGALPQAPLPPVCPVFAPPPYSLDELEMSGPVLETPRILDVVEVHNESVRAQQMDLLPSFDDIQLEANHHYAQEAVEVVPRPAPLQQRAFAGIVDVIMVLLAAEIFNLTFTHLAEDNPHSRMAMLSGLAVTAALWTLYQYLFLVHGHGTPGMQLAGLELATFAGQPVPVHDRRCRALAGALSGFSLGLGYAWALVDEDQLGWHDRITGTLARSNTEQSALSKQSWSDLF